MAGRRRGLSELRRKNCTTTNGLSGPPPHRRDQDAQLLLPPATTVDQTGKKCIAVPDVEVNKLALISGAFAKRDLSTDLPPRELTGEEPRQPSSAVREH
jgi:hypothetical protein